jgi:3-deoxy-manno-octulosonate cytidylyltransferase (CMP-KDO synthetase)
VPDINIFIPARYDSSRYPGKPLKVIKGKPLIIHTAIAAHKAITEGNGREWPHKRLVVLTDDERIYETVIAHGFGASMTPKECANGTERCAWAAHRLQLPSNDIVINWQGDAPLTPARALQDILKAMTNMDVTHSVVTAGYRDSRNSDSSVVSIASRPIPYTNGGISEAMYFSRQELATRDYVSRHIGIYGYRVHALEAYAEHMTERPHEAHEKLEQLRWLEHGYPIAVVNIPRPPHPLVELNSPIDVDALTRYLP